MSNRTVQAAAEGMPALTHSGHPSVAIQYMRGGEVVSITTPDAPADEPTNSTTFFPTGINPLALQGLTLTDLRALRDAVRTIYDVTSGMSCQPRFTSTKRGSYSEASGVFDGLSELFCDALVEIVNEARRRVPVSSSDMAAQAFTVAAEMVEDGDDLVALAYYAEKAAAARARSNMREIIAARTRQ